jgi:LysM domain
MRTTLLALMVSLFVLAAPSGRSLAASACVATVQVQPTVSVGQGVIPAGHLITIQISASAWPQPTTAYVWFRSRDARWKGAASWQSDCPCFVIAHQLPVELDRSEPAVLTIRLHSSSSQPTCTFSGASNTLFSLRIQHLTVLGNGALAAPVPTFSPAPGEGGTSDYIVRWGDTLTSIAAAHGFTLLQVEALNPQIHDPNRIFVGEIIHLR